MILPGGPARVFVATKPVDFRKGLDGLSAVVQEQLMLDPFGDAIFVFRAKRADRVKILVWDAECGTTVAFSGLTMIYKRLEGAKFSWPRIERDIRGRAADERRAVRQTRARPILDARHPWLQAQLERVPSGSKIASALRYPLNHWDGLLLYLDDGRIEILSTPSSVRSGPWLYREKTHSSATPPAGQRAEGRARHAGSSPLRACRPGHQGRRR